MGGFELVDDLRETLDDRLRMALVYEETQYKHIYLDEELRNEYSQSDIERLRREIIVLALGKNRLTDFTHVGELRRIIYDTDDAMSIQFPLGEHEGVFVSIDTENEAELFDVIETTQNWIDRGCPVSC
ncbi:hypothetical protein [Halostella pelagica]|uniref:hypothetical protein n=1 Tax=Halostella pelagica TaxID=2583824 RepID=UPI001080A847|nr:hypothetical protein [Halostella pelagica]